MAKKTSKSAIKCRATHRHLLNGNQTHNLEGIRVTVAYPQKRTLRDLAESINNSSSAGKADVVGVWTAMEEEIIRALEDGRRVALGNLGTLRLEVGTKAGKSTAHSITSKDIEAKGLTFQPSKKLIQLLADFAFECDGIVEHPLSEVRTEETLAEFFATHQYLSVRNYAMLCHCSESTARRRIAEMVADGRLVKSAVAKGLYELVRG